MFMKHNETANVMSHLLGAVIYIYMLVYVVMNLQPPTMTNQGLIARWTTSGFETGRLDEMLCPVENFKFTND